MLEPVQICFAKSELAQLFEDQSLHAIVRAAVEQRVLRLLLDAPEQNSDELRQLTKLGIRIEAAANPESCDYIVRSADAEHNAVSQATDISYETFRQYVRKMI